MLIENYKFVSNFKVLKEEVTLGESEEEDRKEEEILIKQETKSIVEFERLKKYYPMNKERVEEVI